MRDAAENRSPKSSRRTAGTRAGGRSARVVRAILQAAIVNLAEHGYAQLRLENVAAYAGVAKTTLYRRWPRKAQLIEDAARSMAMDREELPDTGSLREDLFVVLENMIKLIATPLGKAMARLMVEGADPEIAAARRRLASRSAAFRARIVERALTRGTLRAGTDARLIVDTIFSVGLSRALRFGERFSREERWRLVDLVVTGAEHGGGRTRPSRGRQRPKSQRAS